MTRGILAHEHCQRRGPRIIDKNRNAPHPTFEDFRNGRINRRKVIEPDRGSALTQINEIGEICIELRIYRKTADRGDKKFWGNLAAKMILNDPSLDINFVTIFQNCSSGTYSV